MFGRFGELRRKLRAERQQHVTDLKNANREIERLTQAMRRANKTIRQLEGQVAASLPPVDDQSGQIVYAIEDIAIARPNHHLAQFHTVGLEDIDVHNQETKRKGKVLLYLQENGYGDRRIALDGIGDCFADIDGKFDYWGLTKKLAVGAPLRDWLMRAPDCEIKTKLPRNADPEDRSWEALGADPE